MSFVFPNPTDNNVLSDIQTLDQRLEGLFHCAQRLGVEGTDSTVWTSILSDVVALAGAFHMCTKEVVPRLQTKSVIPFSPTLDIKLFADIPNLLAVVKAPDELREISETPKVAGDLLKRRLRAQMAAIVEGIKLIEQANTSYSPPAFRQVQKKTTFQIQQEVEDLQQVIAAVYNGTTREQF